MTSKLACDFRRDVRGEYVHKLGALGVFVPPSETLDDVLVRYFSMVSRRIDRAVRSVVWSTELRQRASTLLPDYQKALATIERLSLAGDDLNPYQSRDLVKRPSKNDLQLLEWGVTHFHLGLRPHPKLAGMVASTPDLLFVVVGLDALFFVEVLPHNSFSDENVFAVATKNWPQRFGHAALSQEVVGLEHNPTAAERAELRAANINVFTPGSDGRFYAPIGGGRTTSGASLNIVRAEVKPRTGPITAWQRFADKTPERVLAMIPESARVGLATIELHATETSERVITFSATNLLQGQLVLGTGYPPD